MKLRKIFIRIGLALLIIVTAVLAVRAVFNYAEGRKLARAVAELKENGIPTSAKDLAPPCPDGENAARLWKAAENLLEIEGEARANLSRAWADFANDKPLDPADREGVIGLIAKNELALRLMREMSGRRCFFFRERKGSLVESMIPNAIMMIPATRLLGFEALFMAEKGDVSGAVERLRADLKSSPKVAEEGLLLTYLLGAADTRILLDFLAAVCQGRVLDEAMLVSLIAELDPGPWRSRLALSLSAERVFGLEWGYQVIGGKGPSMLKEKKMDRLFYWLIRPVFKSEVTWRLRQWGRWERIADKPYFQQREILKGDPEYTSRIPWYFKLTGYEGGAYGTVFLKQAMLEATFLASRTGLACKLHKSRTGEYPDKLEVLVPGILKEIPVDPFTGRPFVYRREGDGFIVYSFGSNEKDDGGRSTYMISQEVMDKDDDWTWKEDK